MDRTGQVINNVTIIKYRKSCDIDIMFEDGTVLKNVEYSNLKKGSIKNPYLPSLYGVGFFGIGKYNYKDNLNCYRTWDGMLRRCYDEKNHKTFPTYKECSVDKEWHNYQNFANWFYDNHIDGFQMDKDMLVMGNKIYGKEFCCFIPQDLNKLLSNNEKENINLPLGVCKKRNKYCASISKYGKRYFLGYFESPMNAFNAYKEHKESYIKEIAGKYKSVIPIIVYDNLINYDVKPFKN